MLQSLSCSRAILAPSRLGQFSDLRSRQRITALASSRSRLLVRTMASHEESAAKQAAASGAAEKADKGEPTIFDKIIAKEIPADIVFEDDDALAFRDINPQAPVHILIIPKHRNGLIGLSHATEANKAVLGHLMLVASQVARSEGLSDGFRVVVNDGVNGCQSVMHLHLHLLGGRQLKWPPG
mmetsp:Transcript_7424/g.21965  ORF Transcript_7424/g.21965 Transcript_7424/m.21965 type:complete len:182 (-) Transcript_7424:659-1204(-)